MRKKFITKFEILCIRKFSYVFSNSIYELMQGFPSENTLFTKDVGAQDQVLWLKLMMLAVPR